MGRNTACTYMTPSEASLSSTLRQGDNSNAYKCNFKNKTGMVLSNSECQFQ